jgi:hypothetical protein
MVRLPPVNHVEDDPLINFGRKLIQNWNRRRNLNPVRYCQSVGVSCDYVHVEDDPSNRIAVVIWFPSGTVKVFGVSCG